ncbi:MAG: hypothetical protein EXR51_10300 [Dehalococcoidia bacterium]|nr:hypothetical protein [Dehalococcoidia bacterium]
MGEIITAGDLQFFVENRMQGTGEDGGPTMRVNAMVSPDRVELLRIDMFRVQPHYHYDPRGKNLQYQLDPLTIDDGIGWAIGLVTRKLPQMLEKAGHPELATPGNLTAAAEALPEVERRWRAEGEGG